jgi:hypothetical protein
MLVVCTWLTNTKIKTSTFESTKFHMSSTSRYIVDSRLLKLNLVPVHRRKYDQPVPRPARSGASDGTRQGHVEGRERQVVVLARQRSQRGDLAELGRC